MAGRFLRITGGGLIACVCLSIPVFGQIRITNTYERSEDGALRWTVWVDEDSEILQRLRCVEYTLPPTFRDSVQRRCGEDRATNFSLSQSSNEEFLILLRLDWKDGHVSTQTYQLDLHSAPRKIGTPVAITRSSSELYVLSMGGTVSVLHITPGGLIERNHFSIAGADRPIDLTSSKSDDIESLFVCSRQDEKTAYITQYSPSGKVIKRWLLPDTCTGLDFDRTERAVYFGTSPSNRIFRIKVRDGSGPISVGEIGRAGSIGPIAVDAIRHRVYAGDARDGSVYEFDLTTGKVRIVASGLGDVPAINFAPDGFVLYVADASHRRILQVRTTLDVPRAETFAEGIFRRPSGLAHLGQPLGGLAVSDSSAGSVFLLSSTGRVVSRYP
jgi:hypothetical protein